MLDRYLDRLGVARREPSLSYLIELHRAQVSRVPYTNIEIMRGRPGSLRSEVSVWRVLARRGGYCFQLNGALAWLLRELGFSVSMHRGYVANRGADRASAPLNHLVLVVHDLPEGPFFVDAGLGDALYEPMPLAAGVATQGPQTFELAACERFEGWSFTHDRLGSFATMDFEAAAVGIDAFAGAHERLSTSPESPFTRVLVSSLRHESRVDTLRGCRLQRLDAAGESETIVDGFSGWSQALGDLFDISGPDLAELWPTVQEAHEEWLKKSS